MPRATTQKTQARPPDALLTLFATPEATSTDGKLKGFTGVAYSGGVAPNFGWYGDIAIDLASIDVPPREVPVYFQHKPDKIVGRAKLVNDGKSLRVLDGRFSDVTEVGKEVAALMAEGHPWQLSVGINGKFETQDRAKPVKVNGQSLTVDGVFRKSRIVEFSFVGSGADPNTYAAQLSAELGVQPPGGSQVDADQLEQLQGRIAELTTQNAQLTANLATITGERDTARTELATQATARRNDRITALFGKEHGLTDAEIAEFRSMTDAQFAVFETRFGKERETSGSGALFQQQAAQGRDPASQAAAAKSFAAPGGYQVDQDRAVLHAKALKFQAEHPNTTYLAAVTAVTA